MKKFKIPPCQNHSLSPISRALATAPQNRICFAPFIRVSLRDACRLWAGGCLLQTSSGMQGLVVMSSNPAEGSSRRQFDALNCR